MGVIGWINFRHKAQVRTTTSNRLMYFKTQYYLWNGELTYGVCSQDGCFLVVYMQ